MQTNDSFTQSTRQRVIFFIIACLGVLVFAAVVYRVENPSIVQHEEERHMPGAQKEGMGGMAGIADMMKHLQENPDDIQTMRSLGMSFMDMQAWDKALPFWDMVLKKQPGDAMALNQKGFCLFELGKFAEAATVFEDMLRVDATNAHAHYNLGVVYKHYLAQPDKAAEHFQGVLKAAPEDKELLENARRELADK